MLMWTKLVGGFNEFVNGKDFTIYIYVYIMDNNPNVTVDC
jgi:hypothetical protein